MLFGVNVLFFFFFLIKLGLIRIDPSANGLD